MNKRIAAVLASAGTLLAGPSALAAVVEPAPGPSPEVTAPGHAIFDHGEDGHDDGDKGGQGEDDHDHDGDGRPDHDPEDHDDDEKPKDDE